MKYCFLILSALLVVSSCKKVEDPKSYEDMLRDGKWRMELDAEHGLLVQRPAIMPNPLNIKQVDTIYAIGSATSRMLNDTTYIAAVYPDCQADDYLVFREGIIGALNTGELKCPQGEVAEIETHWGFRNNYTQMYIYDAPTVFRTSDVLADVKEFSADRFTITYSIINNLTDIPKKDTVYYTATFKKF
jgi:hypothetical protein